MAFPPLKIASVQFNPKVGDIVGNFRKLRELYMDADERGVDLVVTPELSLTGYPLEDLVNNPDLLDAAETASDALKALTLGRRTALVFGTPVRGEHGVHNAARVVHNGEVVHEARKRRLPNYGVFDEKRNFLPCVEPARPFTLEKSKVGLMICEDAWDPEVSRELWRAGANLLIAINASPFRPGIMETRVEDVIGKRVEETRLPFLYVNIVGGQDEMVFDGGSFLLDGSGKRTMQMPQWEECVVDVGPEDDDPSVSFSDFPDLLESIWFAMVVAVRDYARKSGFTDVVLGLSGGIDSAVAAAVAADALGAERVHCVRLPSKHTSDLSNDSAAEMCSIWGMPMSTMPIGEVTASAESTVSAAGLAPDGLKRLTLENIQARARGYLLMTLSNDNNWLLLSTGNKSEIAVGYATLYGDMCGGFNPLKDVYKTTVFALARWRNANRPEGLLGPADTVIPVEIIERPPSAELSPGQKDSDSLPPYDILDAILKEMVEKRTPVREISTKCDCPVETVARVYTMLKRAEYKRRQGAPGPKTSSMAFARDRRIPIVNGFSPMETDELRAFIEGKEA